MAAQSTDTLVLLGKNFHFQDGIYTNYEAFRNNRPDAKWEEVKAEVYTNPQNFSTQLGTIEWKDSSRFELQADSLWGVCLGGIPYIRLPYRPMDKPMTVFAGLQLRGNICYFSFEDEVKRKIPMPVYNPLTGKPYQVGYVERVQRITYEKLLRFESGQIVDFTYDNFREWISDDPKLLNTVNELSEAEIYQKLFKCLLIYDDRNPVKVPSPVPLADQSE